MLRPYSMLSVQQVFHPPQIPRSFFSYGRREQDWSHDRNARRDHGVGYGDERREPPGVVRDARTYEAVAPSFDGDSHVGAEHGIEVSGQDDRRRPLAIRPEPAVYVPYMVDRHIGQADLAEQLCHPSRA